MNLAGKRIPAKMKAGKFCPLSFRAFDYTLFDDLMVCNRLRKRDRLVLQKRLSRVVSMREACYEAVQEIVHSETRPFMKYRRAALKHFTAPDDGMRVWLISDRVVMAGDNGEALFVYLHEHPQPRVQAYFVLGEDSPDFQRMKQYGPVVAYKSEEHRMLQARASMIISSAADENVFDLLGYHKYLVKNFERFKYVFLQHGVIKDDMSSWLSRYNKNIALFVTSAKAEHDSIADSAKYAYSQQQVLLSGLPRHDKLLAAARRSTPERKVLIVPTWRKNLAGPMDWETGRRVADPSFEQSSYYRFYQGLINDERLADAVRSMDYTVDFLIHPALVQEAHKFTSPFVRIATEYDYTNEFVSSTVMVTDFSSVAFDFALLGKPLIYAQFDKDTFYDVHMWEYGYFDYERDGLGPVITSLDAVVEELLRLMANPVRPLLYEERAAGFFFQPPEGVSRCQLILDAILELERKAQQS